MTTSNSLNESLIEYPCVFPIKVMGLKSDEFIAQMLEIARKHDAQFDAQNVQIKDSKGGNYLSLTLPINAKNRAQLDAIYRDLTANPLAKYVL